MSVSAWRIVKAKNAPSAFTGEGARIAGGRWNSPGVAVVYAAETASLAMLEMLVHFQSRELLSCYVLFEVTFDEAMVTELTFKDLPKTWKMSPPPVEGQGLGDGWVSGERSAVLKVPSVIVPGEFNYLLNPSHLDFAKLTIGPKQPVEFDHRLLK
jgi:RES domain-containing protein